MDKNLPMMPFCFTVSGQCRRCSSQRGTLIKQKVTLIFFSGPSADHSEASLPWAVLNLWISVKASKVGLFAIRPPSKKRPMERKNVGAAPDDLPVDRRKTILTGKIRLVGRPKSQPALSYRSLKNYPSIAQESPGGFPQKSLFRKRHRHKRFGRSWRSYSKNVV